MTAAERAMASRVSATAEALELIERLRAAHGPLAFFLSGGCCEGSAPICLREGELAPRAADIRLGELAGAPFFIDAEQYSRWREPTLTLDVAPGASDSLSLEGPLGVHFTTRSALDCAAPSRQNGAR